MFWNSQDTTFSVLALHGLNKIAVQSISVMKETCSFVSHRHIQTYICMSDLYLTSQAHLKPVVWKRNWNSFGQTMYPLSLCTSSCAFIGLLWVIVTWKTKNALALFLSCLPSRTEDQCQLQAPFSSLSKVGREAKKKGNTTSASLGWEAEEDKDG